MAKIENIKCNDDLFVEDKDYKAIVTDCDIKKSKAGKDMYVIDFKVVNEDDTGTVCHTEAIRMYSVCERPYFMAKLARVYAKQLLDTLDLIGFKVIVNVKYNDDMDNWTISKIVRAMDGEIQLPF